MKFRYYYFFIFGAFCLVIFSFRLGNPFYDVNQWSRYALTYAIAEEGRFEIETFRHNTIDWANRVDRNHGVEPQIFYTNKAPGSSFLAVPFYLLEKTFSGLEEKRELDARGRFRFRVCDLFVGWILHLITTLLLGVVYFYLNQNKMNSRLSDSVYASLVYGFGTMSLPLSQSLWGHAQATFFVVLALYAVIKRFPILFGFSFCFSILSEYTAILLFPLLLVLIVERKFEIRDLKWVLLGAFLPGFLFAYYHTIAFGYPWSLPAASQNPIFKNDPNTGLSSIFNSFHPRVMFELLFGVHRGLFILSPVLILPFFGLLFRDVSKWKRLLFLGLGFGPIFIFNIFYNGWHGGNTLLPRYLTIGIPFLILSLVSSPIRIYKYAAWFLLFISIWNMSVVLKLGPFGRENINLMNQVIFRLDGFVIFALLGAAVYLILQFQKRMNLDLNINS